MDKCLEKYTYVNIYTYTASQGFGPITPTPCSSLQPLKRARPVAAQCTQSIQSPWPISFSVNPQIASLSTNPTCSLLSTNSLPAISSIYPTDPAAYSWVASITRHYISFHIYAYMYTYSKIHTHIVNTYILITWINVHAVILIKTKYRLWLGRSYLPLLPDPFVYTPK